MFHSSSVGAEAPLAATALGSLSYAELRRRGATRRQITAAVASGRLIRVRKDTYVSADCPPQVLIAANHGGRVDCLTLLAMLKVFVLRTGPVHVQMTYGSTRVPARTDHVLRHWRTTDAPTEALIAPLIEALIQACRCQPPRAAIATLDSAWHLGLIDEGDIAEIFHRLPQRFAVMRAHLDRRAESGVETLMRLLLKSQGWHVEVQVVISGVGRVDLLVDGWLIVECDSEAFHSGWDAAKRDRRRDLAAAALGYTTVRPIAEDIMFEPERVLAAVRSAMAHRSATMGAHNVADPGRRGLKSAG